MANALRLLKLPQPVQEKLRTGVLSVGHAKVLLGLPGAAEQQSAADRVLGSGLNVRQTEELVNHWQRRAAPGGALKTGVVLPPTKDAHLADLESRLKQRLGTQVLLRYQQGKGAIDIRFFSDAELERLLQLLGVQVD